MISWISAHLKSILTVAFACGVLSLVIRVLDEKLPDEAKRKFGEAIKELSAKGKYWTTLATIYQWSQINRFKFALMYALLIVSSFFGAKAFLYRVGWAPAASVASFIHFFGIEGNIAFIKLALLVAGCIALCVRRPRRYLDWDDGDLWIYQLSFHFLYPIIIMLFIAVPVDLFIKMIQVIWGPIGSFLPRYSIGDAAYQCLLDAGKALLGMTCALSPLWLCVLLRVPALAISKSMYWLLNYPKGPWAGLVFILTIGLGIVRLFF